MVTTGDFNTPIRSRKTRIFLSREEKSARTQVNSTPSINRIQLYLQTTSTNSWRAHSSQAHVNIHQGTAHSRP